jgi:hypothetical protein
VWKSLWILGEAVLSTTIEKKEKGERNKQNGQANTLNREFMPRRKEAERKNERKPPWMDESADYNAPVPERQPRSSDRRPPPPPCSDLLLLKLH